MNRTGLSSSFATMPALTQSPTQSSPPSFCAPSKPKISVRNTKRKSVCDLSLSRANSERLLHPFATRESGKTILPSESAPVSVIFLALISHDFDCTKPGAHMPVGQSNRGTRKRRSVQTSLATDPAPASPCRLIVQFLRLRVARCASGALRKRRTTPTECG